MITSLKLSKIQNELLKWYKANHRNLPWRQTRDPYRIMVSEFMLQQTLARVVIPYFERFLQKFPDISSLSRASDEEVKSMWSGLGYYSRALNLKKAAIFISQKKNFPKSFEEIIELPGVGPYTAAAISSIAFGKKVAVVDGNVARVISRICDLDVLIDSTEGKHLLQKLSLRLLNQKHPAMHNQAMMELGATVCSPKTPTCLLCPVRPHCKSFKNQTQEIRPMKSKRRSTETWLWRMYLVKHGNKILVTNENKTPWLEKVWVLPGIAQKLKKKPKQYDFTHSITHHRIYVKVTNGKNIKLPDSMKGCRWIDPKKIDKLGVSSVVLKALKEEK